MATATKKLDTFKWSGKDKKGVAAKGEIRAESIAAVKVQLRKQGISNPKINKKGGSLLGAGPAIKPEDTAIFMRQMATMMKAGVPLVQAFELVADGLEKATMKAMVTSIRDDVSGGGSFGSSLRKFPNIFDDLVCSLIEAGETAGALETMLDRVALYKEKSEKLKKKIKKAMTYPIAVLVVAMIVTTILLIKVVPQFATTFQSFGADLPAFTQFVVDLSEAATANWWKVAIVLFAFSQVFSQARKRSQKFSDLVDRYMLKVPIIGDILREAVVARFARTLSTTFSAGVPLVDALNNVAGAAGNAIYRDAIRKVRDEVTGGVQINVALRQVKVFPVLLVQMTSIGEESGALDEMLAKVAEHFEEAVDNSVDNLTALLEPMIMSVLGVLVGGLMIAMYLPIFQLGSAM